MCTAGHQKHERTVHTGGTGGPKGKECRHRGRMAAEARSNLLEISPRGALCPGSWKDIIIFLFLANLCTTPEAGLAAPEPCWSGPGARDQVQYCLSGKTAGPSTPAISCVPCVCSWPHPKSQCPWPPPPDTLTPITHLVPLYSLPPPHPTPPFLPPAIYGLSPTANI